MNTLFRAHRSRILRPQALAAFTAVMLFISVMAPQFALAASSGSKPRMYGTFWSLVPPLIAIVLALITKEVYSSLLIGIIVGSMFAANFSFEGTVRHIMSGCIISVVSDSYNVGILIFLVILGAMVALMNKAGGSAAFGDWAEKHIKTRMGAQCATVLLGILIFIDDYFNCLTVGAVMRPVTDKHRISRAKLAYIIDATAAPVCIIAPVSSWAAAVTGFVKGSDGFSIFIRAIPFNYYAWLTLVMLFTLAIMNFDYGPMRLHEMNAVLHNDLYTTGDRVDADSKDAAADKKQGRIADMLVPVIVLIICCIIGMIYTGGFFSGTNLVKAFSSSDASLGLSTGSFFAIIFTVIFYLCRKSLSFKECMDCLPEGFKAMVPAILILVFAWSLKASTEVLGAKAFVSAVVSNINGNFMFIIPAVVFVIGCFIAFATGTSWGTFGILIPIVVSIFEDSDPVLMIISISACMAGSVCGDHCSPISDTTIMASAGAQCNHINHVNTQLPYAMTVAAISFINYMIAGLLGKFTENTALTAAVCLPLGIIMTVGVLFILRMTIGSDDSSKNEAPDKQSR